MYQFDAFFQDPRVSGSYLEFEELARFRCHGVPFAPFPHFLNNHDLRQNHSYSIQQEYEDKTRESRT